MAPLLFLPFMLSIFSISIFTHSLNNISSQQQQQQYLLLQFKVAISNSNNTSLPDWTPSVPLCNWTGVTCHSSSHSILTLNLSYMNLDGTISSLLGNLSSLRSIDLSNNDLTGTIPPQLGKLPRLQVLWLYGNQLQGNIPASLSACRSLYDLELSFNQLDGSIPPELSRLTSMKYLYLGANNLKEYGLGGNVSTKGDVYSYGILILEMVTSKRPSDDMFVGDLNLQKWVSSAFPNRVADVVDSKLLRDVNANMEENGRLLSFIQVGLLCTNESPRERPSMRDVARALENLKTSLTGNVVSSNLTSTISDLLRNANPTTSSASDSQSSTF